MVGINFDLENSSSPHRFLTYSDEETREIGRNLGKCLKKNNIICFFGDLGAGKTTLIKGLVFGVNGFQEEEVNSPTYTYLNIYPGTIPVYHFDLYRLEQVEDFLHMGFEDYLHADGICCIEWSERISEIIPQEAMRAVMKYLDHDKREIEFFLGEVK